MTSSPQIDERPAEQQPRRLDLLPRPGAWIYYFCRYFLRRFVAQRGLQVASALAYTTLLSLVPLLTVMFSFAGGMPVLQSVSDSIQSFAFENFVPQFGETVSRYTGGFTAKASQLTATGVIALIFIALMLIGTIDNALNSIWQVRNRRPPMSRFIIYWAMLSLGPVLVGAGMLSTSYLLTVPVISEVDVSFGLQKRLLSWLPFLTTSAAFTMMYILVPNCVVSRRHALIGGIIAAVLFELAKYGFGIYVKTFPAEAIYGAIAVIPLFLIWIYASWVIVLLGAHITYCLAEFRLDHERIDAGEAPWDFDDAYLLVAGLWRAQRHGRSLSLRDLRRRAGGLPSNQVNEIMELLQAARWVDRTGDGNWILSRDLNETTLLELHRVVPRPLPTNSGSTRIDQDLAALYSVLEQFERHLVDTLEVPLSTLVRRSKQSVHDSPSGTQESEVFESQ